MRGLSPVCALIAMTTGAAADELLREPPALPSARSFSEQIEDKLSQLGTELDARLGPLTMDALDLRVDGRARRARVRLRGESRYLSLHIDGDVHFTDGAAQVETRIQLGLGDRRLAFELPGFEVVPRSFGGERYLEVRVPVISGHF